MLSTDAEILRSSWSGDVEHDLIVNETWQLMACTLTILAVGYLHLLLCFVRAFDMSQLGFWKSSSSRFSEIVPSDGLAGGTVFHESEKLLPSSYSLRSGM